MRKLSLAAIVALVSALVGGVADAARAPSAKPKGCIVVDESLLEHLGVTTAGAVKARGHLGGIGPGSNAWYVATPDGAVWVVNKKPSVADVDLTLPVNKKASQVLDSGKPKKFLYGTTSATDPEIKL